MKRVFGLLLLVGVIPLIAGIAAGRWTADPPLLTTALTRFTPGEVKNELVVALVVSSRCGACQALAQWDAMGIDEIARWAKHGMPLPPR